MDGAPGQAEVVAAIEAAFADVEPPPHWCLANSVEGVEPAALTREFAEVPDWRGLTPEFMDATPDGFGSALSFFSDEAFRYYLPAFVIATVHDQLTRADPVFHLTHGLDDSSSLEALNSRRYGARTWRDYALFRFSVFSRAQAGAIALFLRQQRTVPNRVDLERQRITQALEAYWSRRER